MYLDSLERGSAAVAAICLSAAGFGFVSDALDTGHAVLLVAAIGPQEAQQWIDVFVSAANKLFTLINVMIGIWQTAAVFHHRRRRRRASRGNVGRGIPDAPPRTGGDPGAGPLSTVPGRPPIPSNLREGFEMMRDGG